MSRTALVLRLAFGLLFLLNGLNFYFGIVPIQTAPNAATGEFVRALIDSGFIEIVKFVEVAAGVALIVNRWVPLAAVTTMPVSVGIAFTDVLLDGRPFAAALGLATLLLNLFLLVAYLRYLRPLLTMRTEPGCGELPLRSIAR